VTQQFQKEAFKAVAGPGMTQAQIEAELVKLGRAWENSQKTLGGLDVLNDEIPGFESTS
jgi:hypothetical protein